MPSRGVVRLGEADRRAAHFLRPGVGRHDDDHVAEIGLAAVVVGQRAVVHDLQQQVEHIRMRLLDLIEQQHAVRVLGDRLGQQPALVEAHVAGRRADQARHRVALHVLGHVEAHELDAHGNRELARDLGLADAGGSGEQEAADRLALVAQARARHLDRRAPAPRSPCPGRRSPASGCAPGSSAPRGRRSRRSWPECAPCAPPRPRSAPRRPSARAASAGFRRRRAPASSTTSMALSGMCRSLMWRAASSAAALSASSA